MQKFLNLKKIFEAHSFKRLLMIFVFIFTTFISALTLTLISAPTPVWANQCGERFSNLTSPLCTDAKYILISGALLTEGLYLSRVHTGYKIRRKSLQLKTLGRYSKWGAVLGWGIANGIYTLAAFTYGKTHQDDPEALESAEYMAEASLYTLLTTMILKEVINEARPGFPEENDSFPSGHASMSFAFASAVTARHGWGWGLPSYVFAFFISYSRVQDDRHYIHDLVAGATIGMSYAWGIYYNHKQYNKPYWLTVVPTQDGRGAALTMDWRF